MNPYLQKLVEKGGFQQEQKLERLTKLPTVLFFVTYPYLPNQNEGNSIPLAWKSKVENLEIRIKFFRYAEPKADGAT